jgi:hypothetical protein
MNRSTRSEDLSRADSGKKHRGSPHVPPELPELCSNGQTPSQNPVAPHVPEEDAFETFARGAGI